MILNDEGREKRAVCEPRALLRSRLQARQQTKKCTGCSAPLSHDGISAALFVLNHIGRRHFTSSSSSCNQMTLASGWCCVVLPPRLSEALLAVVLQSRGGRLRYWLSGRLRAHCLQRVDLKCPTRLQPRLMPKYCQTS